MPVLKQRTGLPVIVDPSHGTGDARFVPSMARAAAAAGADGLLIEVHAAPELALSDGKQALLPAEFAQLAADLRRILPLVGKRWTRAAGGADVPPTPNRPNEVIAP